MNDSREKILKVAFKLFLKNSYANVSVNDIVKEINLTKGSFYHHFESKEELFIEVLNFNVFQKQKNLFDSLPKNSLKQFYELYIIESNKYINEMFKFPGEDSLKGISFYNLFIDTFRLIPGYDLKIKEIFKDENMVWTEVVKNAQMNKEIQQNYDPNLIAKLFIAAGDGISFNLVLENRIEDLLNEIKTIWDIIYNGIKN